MRHACRPSSQISGDARRLTDGYGMAGDAVASAAMMEL
jgi:hypothetical protein